MIFQQLYGFVKGQFWHCFHLSLRSEHYNFAKCTTSHQCSQLVSISRNVPICIILDDLLEMRYTSLDSVLWLLTLETSIRKVRRDFLLKTWIACHSEAQQSYIFRKLAVSQGDLLVLVGGEKYHPKQTNG